MTKLFRAMQVSQPSLPSPPLLFPLLSSPLPSPALPHCTFPSPSPPLSPLHLRYNCISSSKHCNLHSSVVVRRICFSAPFWHTWTVRNTMHRQLIQHAQCLEQPSLHSRQDCSINADIGAGQSRGHRIHRNTEIYCNIHLHREIGAGVE